KTGEDHPRFRSGLGEVVAALVRAAKPDAGALDISTNIELDLGLDSLARVELLTEIESRTGAHVAEDQASRIYTLGELLDTLESSSGRSVGAGRGWKELLSANSTEWDHHYIF